MWQQGTRRALGILAVGCCVMTPGCGPSSTGSGEGGGDAGGGGGGGGGGFDDAGAPQDFEDFPVDPWIEPGAPVDAPELFEPPGSASGGPCLLEPAARTLFPRDWIRPRFSLEPIGDQNLFEIRLHTEHQLNDLVVYTAETTWTMPTEIWHALNFHSVGETITVSVRGATYNGSGLDAPPAAGADGSITIAPVAATGTIAYWTTGGGNQDTVAFKGFEVGEETVHQILKPSQIGAGCFGCHSSTPDGEYVAFSSTISAGDGAEASVDLRSVDGTASRPPYVTPAAMSLLGRIPQQAPVFSAGHWTDTDKAALSMYDLDGKTQIAWTNLAATSTAEGVGWGLLARHGDDRSAAAVAFSHDGSLVAYSSSDDVGSGVNLGSGYGDLYTVPYNDGAGGTATPVAGASEAAYSEHYAAFAADDQLLAFVRVPASMYSHDNPASEIFVVPPAGGTAVRLAANDPPVCSGATSPGLTNSWPKWSPDALSVGQTRYYWLTFSSRRGWSGTPQLYITAVTIDETGTVATYPAIYLWNQPDDESNHTPAWDNFDIVID